MAAEVVRTSRPVSRPPMDPLHCTATCTALVGPEAVCTRRIWRGALRDVRAPRAHLVFFSASALAFCRYMHSGIVSSEMAPKSACDCSTRSKLPVLTMADAHGFHTADAAKPAASKMLV